MASNLKIHNKSDKPDNMILKEVLIERGNSIFDVQELLNHDGADLRCSPQERQARAYQ
jgi:hypothetical protein